MAESLKHREVIFEFFPMGAYVKVSAMDVKTLTEISIQGAASASENLLRKNALRRLEYVMRKKGLIS